MGVDGVRCKGTETFSPSRSTSKIPSTNPLPLLPFSLRCLRCRSTGESVDVADPGCTPSIKGVSGLFSRLSVVDSNVDALGRVEIVRVCDGSLADSGVGQAESARVCAPVLWLSTKLWLEVEGVRGVAVEEVEDDEGVDKSLFVEGLTATAAVAAGGVAGPSALCSSRASLLFSSRGVFMPREAAFVEEADPEERRWTDERRLL